MQNIDHRTKESASNRKWLDSADDVFALFGSRQKGQTDDRFVPSYDRKTGLMNRYGLFRSLEKEIDRTKRGFSEGGLLLIVDLDNYLTFNDQGKSLALKIVSKAIMDDIRLMDSAGRIQEDNFFILLPDTNSQKAFQRIQKLMGKLNNLSFICQGDEIEIRASLGFVEYKLNDSFDDILRKAQKKI